MTFNDASSNGNVVLSGTVQPSSVIVNNATTDYTFGGSGRLAGATSLLKSGTGTLTVSTDNTYTGGTVISAGTVIATSSNALSNSGSITLGDVNTGANNTSLLIGTTGTGALTFSRAITVSNQGTGTTTIGRTGAGSGLVTISSTLTLNRDTTILSAASGTLSLTGQLRGSGNITFDGGGVTSMASTSGTASNLWTGNASVTGNSLLLVNSSSNNLFASGTARNLNVAAGSGAALVSGTLKSLTGSGYVGSTTTGTSNLAVGSANTSSTFGGTIGSGNVAGYAIGANVNLTKIGTGTFTLTGANTYTGTTRVTQGTFALAGAGGIANSRSIIVSSGAALDVSSLTSGTFALGSNQTLQAGRTSGFANDIIGNLASTGTLNIAGTGTAGRMTVSNDLALNGGTMVFDLANVTTPSSNDLITLGGALTLSGTTFIAPNLLNGSLTNGTYTLISGGSSLASGSGSNLAWGGTLNRQNIVFDTTTTPGSVFMNVSGAAASLTWSGTNGSLWNVNTTKNWDNAGTPDVFFDGDSVTFNDASSNGSVVLSGTVQPSSVTVNNSVTNYAMTGSGQIAGTSSLLKSGTGTLTMSTDNTYTGGTVISAGTVIATASNALGSGTATLGDSNTGANNASLLIGTTGTSALTFSRSIVVSNQGTGTATIGRTGAGTGLVTISSTMTLNRDTTFLSAASGTLSLTGPLRGNGNATFDGGGITSMTNTSGTTAGGWNGNAFVTGNSLLLVATSTNVFSTGTARNLDVAAGSGAALTSSGTLRMLTGSGHVGSTTAGTLNLAVGSANASSTFGGTIGSGNVAGYAIGSNVNLTKIGTGTFTLTGANTYTGTTRISQGTLALAGAGGIANSRSITVSSGAALDVSALTSGTFSLGSNQTLQAGRTSGFANDIVGNLASTGTLNIAGTGTAGRMTVSNDLALNGGTMVFDLANVTTPGSNDLITLGGVLTLSGTTFIAPNLLNGSLTNGTYTLISGGSSLGSGSSPNLAWGGTLYRQSIAFDTTTTPGSVFMNVSGAAANLVWSGTNGNLWNVNTTKNWDNTGTPDVFFNGDSVTFNDASSNGNVVLSGTVQPSSVTVNNSTMDYDLSGSGQIAGTSSLLKSGTGTLTISTNNTYTGGTVISAGTVIATASNVLGSGTVTLGDINTGANNTSLLIGATGSNAVTFSRSIVVSNQGSGTATIGRTGAGSGLVTINSTVTLNRDTTFLSTASGTLSLTSSGPLRGNGNATFDGGGVTSLTNTGGTTAGGWNGNAFVTGNSLLLIASNTNVFTTGTARNLDVAAGSGAVITNSGTLRMLTGSGHVGSTTAGTLNLAVGSANASSTFSGTIGSGNIAGYAIGANVNLTKIGTGTFTLTGANTYTGTTRVTQGTLALAGAGGIANSRSITVSSGAALDVSALTSGTFALGSNQTLQAGRTSGFANDIIGNLASTGALNIAGTGTAGRMTVSNNLALNGGTVAFDFANVTTPGSNDLITLGGALTLSGTTFIAPNLLNGSLTNGTYTLISGGSSLASGNSSNLAWGGPVIRQGIAFDTTTTPGSVFMNVSGSAANLTWSGSNGNVWNANSATNWTNSGTSDQFYAADSVTFSDASATGNVVLSGTLQPGSVTVNNATTAYAMSGSGQIAGTSTLVKSGTGTLTISTDNSFSGGTVITDGTIILTDVGDSLSALGTGDVTVDDDGTLTGIGTVLGDAVVSGTLAPGNSPGEMHFAGDITLEGDAVVKMEIASASIFDVLDVDGLLTYGGTLQIVFLNGFVPTEGQIFQLFDANNIASGSEFADINISGFTGTFNYSTGEITFSALPEPGTLALTAMGVLLLRRRSRRVNCLVLTKSHAGSS